MSGATVCPDCKKSYPADLDEVNSQGRYINRSMYEPVCDCPLEMSPGEDHVRWIREADPDDITDPDSYTAAFLAQEWYERQRLAGRVLVNQEDLDRMINWAYEVMCANYPERSARLEQAIDRTIDGKHDILNDPTLYVY